MECVTVVMAGMKPDPVQNGADGIGSETMHDSNRVMQAKHHVTQRI